MKVSEMTEEKMKNANMLVVFGGSLLLSFMLSFILFGFVVHQTDYYSLLAGEEGYGKEGSEIMVQINDFIALHGNKYRWFGHGAFHGVIIGIFFVFPIITINALFERRGFKYALIHIGYWTITIALMGGVLCHWG